MAGIFPDVSTSNQSTFRSCGAEAIQGDDMGEGTGVLVIGGGPAGLAVGIAARKKGFDVTVADGAKPPIDKACGGGLMARTVGALPKLGGAIWPGCGQGFFGIRV